ncbi:MAG: hypothetical protein E6Q76_05315 [Rhizobium sp.]|nr:MAG: hypothetical protein E6Q76_05315 [Rhizobium sp.]
MGGRIYFCLEPAAARARSLPGDGVSRDKPWLDLPSLNDESISTGTLLEAIEKAPPASVFAFDLTVMELDNRVLGISHVECAAAVLASEKGYSFVIGIAPCGVDELACRDEFIFRARLGLTGVTNETAQGLRGRITWTLGGWI